jgi:hypothetical protein
VQAHFSEIFRALNESGSRYVVVGGLAVVLHGHLRLTADIDLIIDLEPDAARAAIDALSRIGLRPTLPVAFAGLADPEVRRRWIDDRGLLVLNLWDPANPLRSVDLFVRMPEGFDGLYARSVVVDLQGTPCRIASIDDLIALKTASGRPQDAQDIEALRAIRNEQGK